MTLEEVFADEPAFVPYLAAGDPDYESSIEYVEALARGGADVIELGLPFSEPIAEGPTIQEAVVRALEGGMTPERFFEFVEDLDVDVPLVCMTYYNLIYQYGSGEALRDSENANSAELRSADHSSGQSRPKGEAFRDDERRRSRLSNHPREDAETVSEGEGPRPFVERAAEVGIQGFVVPDLPAEEAGPLREACDEFGLDLVFIVAPTTEGERLERMMEHVSGYVYVQARLGVTGARDDVSDHTEQSLARLAQWDVPKAVGFGIKTGDHAERIVSAGADGIIVGSALVDIIAEGHENGDPTAEVADRLEAKARELKEGAMRGAQDRPQPEHK